MPCVKEMHSPLIICSCGEICTSSCPSACDPGAVGGDEGEMCDVILVLHVASHITKDKPELS